jgi:hypothetical protein
MTKNGFSGLGVADCSARFRAMQVLERIAEEKRLYGFNVDSNKCSNRKQDNPKCL